MSKFTKSQNITEITLAFIAWFAVSFQLYLTPGNPLNFISYFTILSNLIVALSLTFSSLLANNVGGKYFSLPTVKSAIALYIVIVGLVYNLVLRGIWVPIGRQLIVDNLLHVIVPVLYFSYWLIFIPKGVLQWKDGLSWTYFPLLYLCYTLIRGYFTNWYPYPFLNVIKHGYAQVLLNIGLMILTFFVVGLFLIALNRLLKKKP